MVNTGSHGGYQWLVAHHHLADLLGLCPEIVLGKYIAVTSCDSGPLILNTQELATGWESRKGIAYSPRVLDVDTLPREQFDEWYLFQDPFDLGELAQQGTNVFEGRLGAGEIYPFVNLGASHSIAPKTRISSACSGSSSIAFVRRLTLAMATT